MIIERTNGWTQVFVGLLKDDHQRGIRSFGNSAEIITYLKSHPDQEFHLVPLLRGDVLAATHSASGTLLAGDVFTGPLRFDSRRNMTICGDTAAQAEV